MKIYTKTGDQGTTALYSGKRVPKNNIRIECCGTIDELNSWLGLIRDQQTDKHCKSILIKIQENLFTLGAIIATPIVKEKKSTTRKLPEIEESDILLLEEEIDNMNKILPAMTHFILPGGHTTVSHCHITRAVCRRAERKVVELFENEISNNQVIPYLNRLSDYLFVLARKLTHDLQAEEIKWIPNKK